MNFDRAHSFGTVPCSVIAGNTYTKILLVINQVNFFAPPSFLLPLKKKKKKSFKVLVFFSYENFEHFHYSHSFILTLSL